MYAENKMSQVIESIHSLRMDLLGGSYKLERAASHLDSAASEICSFLHKTEKQPADPMPPKIAVEEELPAPEFRTPNNCEKFINQWLEGKTVYPVCVCSGMHLYTAYGAWCKNNGDYKRPLSHFCGFLHRMNIEYKKVKLSLLAQKTEPISARVVIPPDSFIEEQFKKRPYQVATHWITEGYLAFAAYLKGAGLVQEEG